MMPGVYSCSTRGSPKASPVPRTRSRTERTRRVRTLTMKASSSAGRAENVMLMKTTSGATLIASYQSTPRAPPSRQATSSPELKVSSMVRPFFSEIVSAVPDSASVVASRLVAMPAAKSSKCFQSAGLFASVIPISGLQFPFRNASSVSRSR
ncbi:hypothetical protein ACQ3JU_0645 (plasmid) [Bradyrhizobium guangxiense]